MHVADLTPTPIDRTRFHWQANGFVPNTSGCYALTSFDLEVIYVGLAAKSIRTRMAAHLETPEKCNAPTYGMPFWFYFLPLLPKEVNAVERGWLHQASLVDGRWPVLNKADSPVV